MICFNNCHKFSDCSGVKERPDSLNSVSPNSSEVSYNQACPKIILVRFYAYLVGVNSRRKFTIMIEVLDYDCISTKFFVIYRLL